MVYARQATHSITNSGQPEPTATNGISPGKKESASKGQKRGRKPQQPVENGPKTTQHGTVPPSSNAPPFTAFSKVIKSPQKAKEPIGAETVAEEQSLNSNSNPQYVSDRERGGNSTKGKDANGFTSHDTIVTPGVAEQFQGLRVKLPTGGVDSRTMGKDQSTSIKGKKRMREGDVEILEKPKKRRGRPPLNPGNIVKKLSVKNASVAELGGNSMSAKANDKETSKAQGLKWKTLKLSSESEQEGSGITQSTIEPTNLRPRIWTNNRKELLAMMPEMAGSKCVNGVSWELYETPMVLLDQCNPCFQIDRKGKDPKSFDLVTTRSFTCPMPDEVEVKKSLVVIVPPPPRPFEEPTDVKAPEAKPKARRAARYKIPKMGQTNGTVKLDPTSYEIPRITISINQGPVVKSEGSAVLDHSILQPQSTETTFVNASMPNTITLRLAPESDESFPPPAPVNSAPATSNNIISPRTSSKNYILPKLPDRKLTPADSGIIQDFLDVAMNIVNDGEYQSPSCDLPDLTVNTQFTEMENGGLYRIEHSPCSDIGQRPDDVEQNSSHVANMEIGELHRIARLPSDNNGPTNGQVPCVAEHSSVDVFPPLLLVKPKDTQTVDMDSGSQFKSIMADEGLDDMILATGDVTSIPSAPADGEVIEENNMDAFPDYVPSAIPEELLAFVDSYLFGRPLTIMLSNEYLQKHWSLVLPSEYKYAMMGYFRILGIQENRVPVDNIVLSSMKIPAQTLIGKVQWRFHLQWIPGGEKEILPAGKGFNLEHPWWDPPPSPTIATPTEAENRLKDKGPETVIDEIECEPDDPETIFPTAPRYRVARINHHEYKFRNAPLCDLYFSVLPTHMLIPFGQNYMDKSFPWGWFCMECGRMNFQRAMRHRRCPSSFCKDNPPPVAPYAHDLFFLRDPQERLPLSSPLNNDPLALTKMSIEKFAGGMQTFTYRLMDCPNVFMKHIFTSNAPPLQETASALLRDIQINVPLHRPLVDNTPYFLWSAKSPKDNTAPTDTEWTNILPCMNNAKEYIVSRIKSFGNLEDGQLSITRLKILGWITAGSKKSMDAIRAKAKSVVFCALGCTVVLVVTPKSVQLQTPTVLGDKSQQAKAIRLLKSEAMEHQDDSASGWIGEPDNPEDDAMLKEPIFDGPKKGKVISKAVKPTFTITMMHGDIIVFYGDEFEYTIKRDGTSVLLIASHDSVEYA